MQNPAAICVGNARPLAPRIVAIGLGIALVSGFADAQAKYSNLSFNGNSAWANSFILPTSSSPVRYPDGTSRAPGNYLFNSGGNSVWSLNSGATILCKQDWTTAYNAFQVGCSNGNFSSLTFTTNTLLNPGKLCARGDYYASFRIGETSTNSRGKLILDGGVRVQAGLVFGEGPSPELEIINGRFDVFTTNTAKRLNGIAVTLRPNGKLWVEDHAAAVTNASTFSTFASGASISAPGGTLVFTNNAEGFPLWGNAGVSGTLISVNSSSDTDLDGLPDAWELLYQLAPNDNGSISARNGAGGDPDNDGSTNLQEFQRGTNPTDPDTDHDGLADGVETQSNLFVSAINTGTDPRAADTDGDAITDGTEVIQGSNPIDIDDPGFNPDQDGDGLPDAWEIAHQLSPNDNGTTNSDNGSDGDPDHDGVPNAEEYRLDSDPRVNESGYPWQARPKKAAVLAVATHPDDEGIFFGGTIPYYSKVKGIPTILLSMTSGDSNTAPQIREQQLRQAAWTYGLPWQPIFARFKDQPSDINGTWDIWANGKLDGNDVAAGRLKAAMYVAKIIRTYRPEIILTHGANGEYGHGNHMATSQAVVDAWTLAANPAIEIDGLPAWQAQKLYLHEWTQNRLFHDFWETASAALGGKTPREAALAGLQFHYNQSNVSTVYQTGEVKAEWDAHPSEWWGLHSSTVGVDTVAPDFTIAGSTYSGWARGDFLEHVAIATNSAPLLSGPGSVDVAAPWSIAMPLVVTDETANPVISWSLLSGPGTANFSPSPSAVNPTVSFTKVGTYVLRVTANDGVNTSSKDVTVIALPSAGTVMHAIHCGGGSFTSSDGTQWAADYGFSGGSSTSFGNLPITGTQDDALFQKQRLGNCSYNLSVSNGDYLVTLRFAEPTRTQTGLRRFHILLEGKQVTTSLDLYKYAGFARNLDRGYATSVVDGMLNVQFTSEIDQPAIAAILVRSSQEPPSIDLGGQPPALALIDPALDTDRDGVTDRNEFIVGTSPNTPDVNTLQVLSESRKLRFLTRVATGTDYSGFIRRYRVERSPNLAPGSWTSIWTGAADGDWKEIPMPQNSPTGFFRLATYLEAVP